MVLVVLVLLEVVVLVLLEVVVLVLLAVVIKFKDVISIAEFSGCIEFSFLSN